MVPGSSLTLKGTIRRRRMAGDSLARRTDTGNESIPLKATSSSSSRIINRNDIQEQDVICPNPGRPALQSTKERQHSLVEK
mmetsp:Transcript_20374/g.56264  ORF Transcript_20374/g.56264 Transcript_20374/m.56264 type:complete len:81 (-) Transcript_20374:42-284(-)